MLDFFRQFAQPKFVMLIGLTSLTILTFTAVHAQTTGTGSNHIGLVVVHGNGQVLTRCVAFSENELSGEELLSRSGLDWNFEAGGNGAAICRIDNEGCSFPQEGCFCQCKGSACTYWSYWNWASTGWQYTSQGASNQVGHNGDVQGWRWGLGNVDAATSPPVVAFNDICKVESSATTITTTVTATPTATPSATATTSVTPSPTATVTASPSTTAATASPTASLTPTPVPNSAAATATATATNTALTTTATATATMPQSPIATPAPIAPTPVPAPGIRAFSAEPSVIKAGESTVLTWRLVNIETAVLRTAGGEEVVAASADKMAGSKPITPAQTTVYTLVARSRGGEATTQVTVTVNSIVLTPTLPVSLPVTTPVVVQQAQPTVIVSPTAASQVMGQDSPLGTPSPTLAALRFDLTPTAPSVTSVQRQTDAADLAQTQNLLLFGGLTLALIVPVGLASLVMLIWMIVRRL